MAKGEKKASKTERTLEERKRQTIYPQTRFTFHHCMFTLSITVCLRRSMVLQANLSIGLNVWCKQLKDKTACMCSIFEYICFFFLFLVSVSFWILGIFGWWLCDDGCLTSNSLIHIECEYGRKGFSICYSTMCMRMEGKKRRCSFLPLCNSFNLYTTNKPHFKDLISCSLCRLIPNHINPT